VVISSATWSTAYQLLAERQLAGSGVERTQQQEPVSSP
jgi:hypothetical protein